MASRFPHRLARLAPLGAALLVGILSAPAAAQGFLTAAPAPAENPVTKEKALLGKFLFWDEQLSSDGSIACGTCHIPGAGGSDPRIGPGSVHPGPDGIRGNADDIVGSPGVVPTNAFGHLEPRGPLGLATQITGRHSPSFLTAAWFDELFWDGRVDGKFSDPLTGQIVIQSGAALEAQSLGPIVSDVEMADRGRGWAEVVQRLKRVRPLALASDLPPELDRAVGVLDSYPKLFQRAFGSTEITPVRIAFALATYQRSLVPDATPFDDFMRGDQAAMTAQQVRGMNLFDSTAVCAVCHTPPLFANGGYHSIALRPSSEDPGRYGVTGDPLDLGRFKTPSLRNVALRGRYFHNGTNTIPTLRGSVEIYNGGGGFDNLDPVVGVIDMTPAEIDDITAYLEALTDPRVEFELPPFDRPRLRSERSIPNPDPTGVGAVAGHLSREPRIITTAAPFVAADRFRLAVVDVRPGAFAAVRTRLGAAGGYTAPGGALALGSLLRPAPVITSDDGQGGGYATAAMPIRAEGAMRGVSFDAQWLVRDPAAVGGIARSQIVRVTVE